MEAAQALTLTDDHDRQLEALKRFGNSAHQIRRMLTETKIGTASGLFLFVGHDAYAAAGGTITADLFAEGGDGYADDPELVETLATAKLSEIADGCGLVCRSAVSRRMWLRRRRRRRQAVRLFLG